MRIRCFLLFFLLILSSCAQTPDSIQVTGQTNRVAETNLNLGVEYLKRGNYEKALDKLNRALEADPKYPPTYNALGILYQKLGKPNEAEGYFKHALRINPAEPQTLNNYGQLLCTEERYEDAEQAFLKAAGNPLYESPEISLTNAGTCALKSGNVEAAETHFREALNINPRVAIALLQMSQLSYDNDNYLSARAYLQRYLEVGKHTAKTLWLGIQIEKELGDRDTLSSYALSLRNNFPRSEEARLLQESGLK
ncbi:MAG: type IV pilus biogenesis/stability protein PilW [Gammaproteobacteria bacterium]|nr:type IV pilus biogenesis/stability protein PilW [Gammaproteobacteria bacterium]NIN62776.1 type IV pilus biogenesis/stability protein PilW [Gammaproteobacteria bacterium]NIO63757.1 type IV pilus biogenesis/stability protein PilW [Gammaproteobacteria bacterium]NIP50135.1 type IV pilus biogenesis/stability protein PilW [Gammaproteobacteria bacterium]NIQ12353.1 type IV pilus biogenesis/stability protein PilW [Gammaproteobacteria bacterium]